jgi:4'-phosphopantetheinyl transferase
MERASRLRRSIDRDRFVGGRVLTRRVLAERLNCRDNAVPFEFGPYGKPFIRNGPAFNLSHSGTSVLLGVTHSGQLGVDIQDVEDWEDINSLAQRVFSAAELSNFFAHGNAQRRDAFFRGWARKEAFIKALGTGLAHDLKSFEVTLERTKGNSLASIDGNLAMADPWCVRSVNISRKSKAAVALNQHHFETEIFDAEPFLRNTLSRSMLL